MQPEVQNLTLKVHEHDIRLEQFEKVMTEGIQEQRELIKELHALNNRLGIYIEKHDGVTEANKRLWKTVQSQAESIDSLQISAAANQPIIDGIRSLNAKLVWAILGFFLSPAALAGIYLYTQGGQQ